MTAHLARWWFLCVLAVCLVAGFTAPAALAPIAASLPRQVIVASVLFLMALPLESSAMWRAVRHPAAVVLAVSVNYLLLPLSAWAVAVWMRPDLGAGLLIVGAVPCTIASAAVWTRRAGGNDAVAIMVTMITNLACFVVTPLWLVATTGTRVEFDPLEMMARLAGLVVVPTLAAQLVRQWSAAGRWATARKIPLGVLGQCGILSIVLVGAIDAGLKLRSQAQPVAAMHWLAMLAAVVVIHVAMLAVGHALGRLLGIDRADRVAVGFAGSQKTLMIGLHVALTYYGGLAMLPMVSYHVCQLLVDTVVAERLRAPPPSGS